MMTLSITTLCTALAIKKHKAECNLFSGGFIQAHNAECRSVGCHFAKGHYSESGAAKWMGWHRKVLQFYKAQEDVG
jgi:hypothetical protein